MNFVTDMNYMLIIKMLFVLAVVVVAVAASPSCISYCDVLNSGWKVIKRPDCNCLSSQKKVQDEVKYNNDLKSILIPLKSRNHQTIIKDIDKNQKYETSSLVRNDFSGFGNTTPDEINSNKIKRTIDRQDTLVGKDEISSTTSISDDLLDNTHISKKNLSDCIDLHILIKLRKNNNKNIANSDPNVINTNKNFNDIDIITEIKSKCDQTSAILQKSVAEIKENKKKYSNRKNQNYNITPDIKTVSKVTDEEVPKTHIGDDISTIKTIESTTPYDETSVLNRRVLNAITETDKSTNNSREVNNLIAPEATKISEVNIREEPSDKYINIKILNDSIENNMTDDKERDITRNSIVNNTSTNLKIIQDPNDIKNYLSYNLTELQKKNIKEESFTEKPLIELTVPETVLDKNMSIPEFSDNGKENISKTDQFLINNNNTMATESVDTNKNNTSLRDIYMENEVPIARIITREYPNDTISSVINGTENLPNSDFKEMKIKNNETENQRDSNINLKKTDLNVVASESVSQSIIEERTPSSFEEQTSGITIPAINGRIHFVYGQKHIPGYFVQTPDGKLQLSLDLNNFCN